jgi:hypothetical protein
MHPDRDISIAVDVAPALVFRGEREDLEEMAGNLIDNASNGLPSRIAVHAAPIDGGRFPQRVR